LARKGSPELKRCGRVDRCPCGQIRSECTSDYMTCVNVSADERYGIHDRKAGGRLYCDANHRSERRAARSGHLIARNSQGLPMQRSVIDVTSNRPSVLPFSRRCRWGWVFRSRPYQPTPPPQKNWSGSPPPDPRAGIRIRNRAGIPTPSAECGIGGQAFPRPSRSAPSAKRATGRYTSELQVRPNRFVDQRRSIRRILSPVASPGVRIR
jgi:hypothetical protein